MRKFIIGVLIGLAVVAMIIAAAGCKNNGNSVEAENIEPCPADTLPVYDPLLPNDTSGGKGLSYGPDHIPGFKVEYSAPTDSADIYVAFDINMIQGNPQIAADVIEYIHDTMLGWGFLNENDTVVPVNAEKLAKQGISQKEIMLQALNAEKAAFYRQLPNILEWEPRSYCMDFDIYPVFLKDDIVTYRFYAYYDTGGAHGNFTSYLYSYDLRSGRRLTLADVVEPDKIGAIRHMVVAHMAASYPIYKVKTVSEYLDSLNVWLGDTDLGEVLGCHAADDGEEPMRLTEDNYPLPEPALEKTGLVFVYQRYILAPGVCGCPVVVLPYSDINNCLKPQYRQ